MHGLELNTESKYICTQSLLTLKQNSVFWWRPGAFPAFFVSKFYQKRHFSQLIQLGLLKCMVLRERPTFNTYTVHPCWLWNKAQYSCGVPAPHRHLFVSKFYQKRHFSQYTPSNKPRHNCLGEILHLPHCNKRYRGTSAISDTVPGTIS
jgi:hypothetical protein